MQRKVDPKRLRFGSRIDGSERSPKYHSVVEVLSPCRVLLDSGIEVELLGVRPVQTKAREAVGLLQRLTKGHRVEIRTDGSATGGDRPAVYLYLANKTFVNAKLIKSGLVRADTRKPYRWRQRFVAYASKAREGEDRG